MQSVHNQPSLRISTGAVVPGFLVPYGRADGPIEECMGALIENWRGGNAMARWLLGAPVMNLRVILAAKNKQHARNFLMHRCVQLLNTCRISVGVSGTPPQPGAGCVLL